MNCLFRSTSALLFRVLLFGRTRTSLKSNLMSESTLGIVQYQIPGVKLKLAHVLLVTTTRATWLKMTEVQVARDTPTLASYLTDINGKLEPLKTHVCLLLEHLQSLNLECKSGGVDILELKNHLLLSYVIDVVHLVLLKCREDEQCAAVVDRLVEIRTIVEKIRPLEQRFSYQLDKLLRTASSKFPTGGEHPLQFRPAPENLVSKVAEQSNVAWIGDSDAEEQSALPYVPPRVVAMPYKEESRSFPRMQVEKSRLISELRDELTDFPTEVQNSGGGSKKKILSNDKIRESYEEEYMVRLSSKKKSHDVGRRAQQDLEELVDFSSFKGITTAKSNRKKRLKKNRTVF